MKIAVFIDADAVARGTSPREWRVDWNRVRAMYAALSETTTLTYFGLQPVDDQGHAPTRGVHDFLSYNGYRVRIESVLGTPAEAVRYGRPRMLVGMAVEMVEAAQRGAEVVVIWTDDNALCPAIEAIQRAGASVTIVASRDICGDDLRRAADTFTDVVDLRGIIALPAKARA